MADLQTLLNAYLEYIVARNTLLDVLRLRNLSNRDPMSEFSEQLVAALLGGTLADSRVQKGWDVLSPEGEKIQVKYLANNSNTWVNEHLVQISEYMDSYAIVFFESLLPQAVIIFPVQHLFAIGTALGKRHGNLEKTLQFTRINYRQILKNVDAFKVLGVRVYRSPDWLLQ